MEIRIGILETYRATEDLAKKHGDFPDMFADLIPQDQEIEVTAYNLTEDIFPVDLHACDAYIISGSKYSVYDDIPWINKAKALVRNLYDAKIPTIGICFGHQIIAEALGGKVEKATNKGWGIGNHTWQITSAQKWMQSNPLNSFSLLASHQDQVTKMPEGSILIASSHFCPIAGFEVGKMMALQGHPEFTGEYLQDLLLKRILTGLEEEQMQSAIDTLDQAVDSAIVAAWMVDFIKSSRA